MTKGIFITATGTDSGKTYISGLLVKKMREFGLNCGYYKPVLSGLTDGCPGDVDFVLKTAQMDADPFDFVSFSYKHAVSPHLAARIEGNPVCLDKIKSDFERLKQEFDYVVTEGAGGIVCPFKLEHDEKILLPDVIKALDMNILIVAPADLGTINSTFLTVEYAKSCGINIKGIILNNFDENNIMHADNRCSIENLTGIKVIAAVKACATDFEIEKDALLSVFEEI